MSGNDGDSTAASATTSTATSATTSTPTATTTTTSTHTKTSNTAASTLNNPSICAGCGGQCDPSTSYKGDWSSVSSLPYRPIRAPALNVSDRAAAREAIISTPVPQPLDRPLPILSPPFSFLEPSPRISSPTDVSRFLCPSHPSSPLLLGFLASLSRSALGKPLSHPFPSPLPAPLPSLLHLLHTLTSWIDAIPPSPHPSRYGNPSFRLWHSRLSEEAPSLISPLLPPPCLPSSLPELVPYLLDSFGNPSRIDYGTGHELHFAAFLFCLARLGVLREEDHYSALVLKVFSAYLDLMRRLQLEYSLEPAGSHGVWGLDDYHFLPFIFGAAQLVDHKYMKPKSIHNQDILDTFSKDYMYLACVDFVKKVKKGPFAEHSPLLDDISAVPNWRKVNGGLLKMYKAEVLGKVPIMQHFLFGSIIPWE